MLDIVIPLNCDLTESEEVDFRENLEPMDYLAQAMHGAVHFSDESWSVVVCLLAHYPEERYEAAPVTNFWSLNLMPVRLKREFHLQ